jgi:hypothetical protein
MALYTRKGIQAHVSRACVLGRPRERHARMRFESTASKNIAKLHSKLDRLTPLLQMFIHALLARKNRAYLLERNIASNHAETTGLTLDDWHHET